LGGKAANFLDIGGGSAADAIRKGFVLVMSKPEVKAVLVNVLGGITRCDVVARGVVEALEEVQQKKTVVVRLMGTNEDEGRKILAAAGITVYPDMETAVKEVVRLTRS
jgi:succinyl-CoA synthetase beta subunit